MKVVDTLWGVLLGISVGRFQPQPRGVRVQDAGARIVPCSPSNWVWVSAHVGEEGASAGAAAAPGNREDSNARNRLVSHVSPALSMVESRRDRFVSAPSSRLRFSREDVLGDGRGVFVAGRDGTRREGFLSFFPLPPIAVSKSS